MSSSSLVSQVVLGLVLSLTSIGVGYQLGIGASSTRDTPSTQAEAEAPLEGQSQEQDIPALVKEEQEEENLEDEGIPDGDLASVSAGFLEPCKMALIVRTDLKLSSGSIAAQCCQATLACYKVLSKKNPSLVNHWEYTGQAKIALKAKSEDQLLELEAIAKSLNLCARSVLDPEKGDDVRSVLAIGPAPVGLVNEVTGKLRLL